MGDVTKLKPSNAEEHKLPPFDISIAVNLDDGRQIQLRSPVPDAISKGEADRRFDGLMGVVERQRSLFAIRSIEMEQQDKRTALVTWQKTRDEKNANLPKRLKAVADEIEKLMIRREEVTKADQMRHDASRHGAWRAQGAVLKQLSGITQDIEAKKLRIGAVEAEHEQDMQTVLRNIEQLEQHIHANERVLAEHRKIVEG